MAHKAVSLFFALTLSLAVTGCGTGGRAFTLAPTGPTQLRAAADEADLPLDRMPEEELVVPTMRTRAPHAATTGNGAVLTVGPSENLAALRRLILDAKASIYLETFDFGNEGMGAQLVPLLAARAQEGLEVKVVMDYIGSRFTKGHKQMVATLRAAGVEVLIYRPRTIVKDDKRIGMNITHRKLYLADGRVALVGGVNLSKGFDDTTQDLLIAWTGPVVAQLYAEYAHDWKLAKGGPLNQQPVDVPASGDVEAQIVVTSPGEARYEARDAIYRAIDTAQVEVRIENQYLWDDRMITRLLAALKRGVKVRAIVPGGHSGEVLMNVHGGDLLRLQQAGAEVRLYRGPDPNAHLHAKYFGVDDAWAATGSVNADTRALVDNQELDILITDPALARAVQTRLFERDWAAQSVPYVHQPGNWILRRVRNLAELIDYYL